MDLKELQIALEELEKYSIAQNQFLNGEQKYRRLEVFVATYTADSFIEEKFNELKGLRSFYSDNDLSQEVDDYITLIRHRLEARIDYQQKAEKEIPKISNKDNKIFIIHGHDGSFLNELKLILAKQKIEFVVLSDVADEGRTIFQKVQDELDKCRAAIVIYTPADELGNGSYQARPNVIFEHGYAIAKLGASNVVMINNQNDEKEMPVQSDIAGLMYIPTTDRKWDTRLLRNLDSIGFKVDFSLL